MEPDIRPRKPSLGIHDDQNCPLVARVQALQTELSYYKAICQAYETGRLKPQPHKRRIMVHKHDSQELDKFKLMVPQTQHIEDFKKQQMRFSQQIDKKIKKGVKKTNQNQPQSLSMTPMMRFQSGNFQQAGYQMFYLQDPISKTSIIKQQTIPQALPIQQSTEHKQDQGNNQLQKSNQQPEIIRQLDQHTENLFITVNPPQQPQTNIKQLKPTINLISDLCLFGNNQKELKNLPAQKINEVNPQLLFSMFDLNSKQYYDQVAKYLFPNGLYARTIRHQKILSEANQILLQNIKKHSNFIYELKSELKMEDIKGQQKQLLQWINPSLKLFCISILVNDFSIVDPNDPILSDQQKSIDSQSKSPAEQIPNLNTNRSDHNSNKINIKKRRQSKQLKHYNIYSNKRIISIFTYFPFFQFFESLLIGIFNALKIQKLGIYQNKLDSIFQIDSSYLLQQLQSAYIAPINQINTTIMSPGLDYQFTLGVDAVKISTNGTKLIDACIGAWLFPVLKLFDKNTFYDILTAILFQEQVIFVCDNLHMLTYSIYLFTEVLIRPFRYQHSAIYIVSYWDLLDAPTPIVLGINKPSQWLQQTQLRQGHIYVQIGQQATIIDKRKQHKKVKSQKLRKILSGFFKSIDRDGITFFKQKKKKDGMEYSMVSTKQQKQLSMLFISSVNVFMKQELVDVIPNPKFMQNVKQKFRWSNKAKNQDAATIISEEIIKEILRVRKQKDPFIQKFLRTQIFLTFLFDLVRLDDQ